MKLTAIKCYTSGGIAPTATISQEKVAQIHMPGDWLQPRTVLDAIKRKVSGTES
jgi:hypothetical protein